MNKSIDLALEMRESMVSEGDPCDGILFAEEERDGIYLTTIDITDEGAAKKAERSIGRYVTIDFGKIWLRDYDFFVNTVELIAEKISMLSNFRKDGTVLIAGLGNSYITPDSLGPEVLSRVIITRHLKDQIPDLYDEFGADLAGIAPGVLGQTGIESAEIILSLAERLKPNLIIAIDALASQRISRLATTIQLSDTGISPGSGVGNRRAPLTKEFLGTEVISIGVPTVVDAATLSFDVLSEAFEEKNIPLTREVLAETLNRGDGNFFVTPKENDIIISELAKVIGYAINRAFFPSITFNEMARLV